MRDSGWSVRRFVGTLIWDAVMVTCFACVAYAALVHERPDATAWLLVGVVGGIVFLGTLVGTYGSSGAYGLLDLVKWWREHRSRERRIAGRCVHCGYSIEGLGRGAACPECGRNVG